MASNNLDDLFRQQLGQHATPPGEDLQRRLAELAEAERLDALFRTGLGSVASQPRREVWERLEDEHLRPQPKRRRRVVAWWQLSTAAVLLLTLLAGGLWRGGYLNQAGGRLATRPAGSVPRRLRTSPISAADTAPILPQTVRLPLESAPEQSLANGSAASKQKNVIEQATGTVASSSSNPIATTTRPRRTAPTLREVGHFHTQHQQLDAAAGPLATTERQNSQSSQSLSITPKATATAISRPDSPVVAATMTSQPEVVEVEVRRGPEPSHPAPVVVAAAEAAPVRRPRLRLGGLLRQADHLVHGEPVSLAEATGLAETVTVQARLGGHTLSKTIQL